MRRVTGVRRVTGLRGVAVLLLVCLGLGACSAPDQSGSPGQRVRAWASGVGLSGTTSQLSGDAAQFAVGRPRLDHAVLQSACTDLLNDASMGAAGLPTPDPMLTAELNRAYDAYYRAGQLCLDTGPGGSGGSRSGPGEGRALGQAAAQMAKGSAGLAQAQARIRSIVK